jgi:hypothetical protein
MIRTLRKTRLLLALPLILASLALAGITGIVSVPTVMAANMAAGTLHCSTLTQFGNTSKYALQAGATVTCTITGATDLPAGATSVTITIMSSDLGNTTVTGTVSGTTITFSYTAPTNGCNTTVLSYLHNGHLVNSPFSGPGNGPAGFAFVDAQGNLITTCTAAPTSTNTPTNTPTNTNTSTPTDTNTPVPPTNTNTSTPTVTNTPIGGGGPGPGGGATPELPSGSLLGLGVLPVLAVFLYRRNRQRRTANE